MIVTIAIDGPVGAGKSSIAAGIAHALGILHLDTGAMYRALGLKALREGMDPGNSDAANALADATDIAVSIENGQQQTWLDGENVTTQIRDAQVSAAASAVSKAAGVRRKMVRLQQEYAARTSMVLDGRDIGTRVLPNATYKFFLTASPEIRAMRRYAQYMKAGDPTTYDEVLKMLIARDKQDCERAIDPLRPACDARIIDTTTLNEADVLAVLLGIIRGDRHHEARE